MDDQAISEIVGALLLVVVVSTAAFGFGMFLHEQSRITQEQKASEQAKRLELLSIPALALSPVDQVDPCDGDPLAGAADGTWDTITLRIASEHLKPSTIRHVRINGMTVQELELAPFDGSNVVGFDADDAAFVVKARESIVVQVKHASCTTAASPFFDPSPIPSTGPIQVELLTDLGNLVEQAFIPPNPIIVLDTRGAATTSFILDGSRSTPGKEDGFLVQWSWSITCTASDPDCNPAPWITSGRVAQASIIGNDATNDPGTTYTLTLTVKDNFGMTSSADFDFTL